jgi:hypothetical protein
MERVWQKSDEHRHICHSWQVLVLRQTCAMDTNSTLDSVFGLLATGVLLAPVAYLLERTHRRDRREHGTRTSWSPAPHDADRRRIADDLSSVTGSAHR